MGGIYMKQVNEFATYLKRQGKSIYTIYSYCIDIKQFLLYIENRKEEMNTLLKEYKTYLLNNGYDVKSVNRKIIAIREYFKYFNQPLNVKLEKIQTQNFLDDILDIEEINRVIRACELHNDLRAKTLIMTLYYTGMRISECLQLTIDDIDKDYVNIIGKGNKHRMVFIPQKLKELWAEYMKVRKPKGRMLFTGQKGPINRTTAHTIIKKYGELAGVDIEKCHCHTFRHVFCKRLVDKNIPLDTVAALAGHENIMTTILYTKKTKKELLNVINDL